MKTFINYILSIILALTIILFYFINLASSTILSEQYILSKLDEHDYYNKIHEQIKSNFENYIHQSGLEEDVLDNIITKEKVKKDTHIILGSIYDGLNQEVLLTIYVMNISPLFRTLHLKIKLINIIVKWLRL